MLAEIYFLSISLKREFNSYISLIVSIEKRLVKKITTQLNLLFKTYIINYSVQYFLTETISLSHQIPLPGSAYK